MNEILKLTNLAENYDISELTDNCLSKNTNKIIRILNENNYSVEDCILITRNLLTKAKRILSWQQKVSIDEGLQYTYSWAKDHM